MRQYYRLEYKIRIFDHIYSQSFQIFDNNIPMRSCNPDFFWRSYTVLISCRTDRALLVSAGYWQCLDSWVNVIQQAWKGREQERILSLRSESNGCHGNSWLYKYLKCLLVTDCLVIRDTQNWANYCKCMWQNVFGKLKCTLVWLCLTIFKLHFANNSLIILCRQFSLTHIYWETTWSICSQMICHTKINKWT